MKKDDEKTALERKLREADEAYWERASPVISDQEYDKLAEKLRKLDPGNEVLSRLPSAAGAKKVKHAKPMLSLAKAYTLEEVLKWCAKTARTAEEKFLVQPKYDGMSGEWSGGKLSSRGDGEWGEDYTAAMPLIKFDGGDPAEEPYMLGELVIEDADWKWLQDSGASTKAGTPLKSQRNAAAGILGTGDAAEAWGETAKKAAAGGRALLTFKRYSAAGETVTMAELEKRWEELVARVRGCGSPADGVVVKLADEKWAESLGATEHHPRGAVAFKFANEAAWTVLEGVKWAMGKEQLACVGLVRPVQLGGVTVKRVKLQLTKPTAAAAVSSYLLDGSLQVGDSVLVERAGDVIPHVAASKPGKTRQPVTLERCPFCGGPVRVSQTSAQCAAEDCPKKKLEKTLAALTVLGFKGMGDSVAEKLGAKTVAELLSLRAEDLKSAGLGPKTAETFLAEQAAAKRLPAAKILEAMSFRGLGSKSARLLMEKMTWEDLSSVASGESEMKRVQGVGQKLAEELAHSLRERREELAAVRELLEPAEAQKAASAAGPEVCFTGKSRLPRSQMEKLAAELGMTPVGSVTAKTALLVRADDGSGGSKLEKARKLGVKTVTESEFFKMAEAKRLQLK